MIARALTVLAAVAACQGRGEEAAAPARDAARADAGAGGFGVGAIDEDDDAAPVVLGPAEPEEDAPAAADVERLGAIPAWKAVVDRDQYLARRGQGGVVYGRIGGAVPDATLPGATPDAGVVVAQPAGLVWLVDETEGNGALAIRIRVPTAQPAGARVAVRGAWKLDEARRWYWDAETVTPLPATEPPPETVEPGLRIDKAMAPGGWSAVRSPDKVKDGEICGFTVVSVPANPGEGWGVSDKRWGTLMAYVRLPGEDPSFGGHDLRAADERWVLRKGWSYWVRVRKVRRRGAQLPVIEAATPPVLFP